MMSASIKTRSSTIGIKYVVLSAIVFTVYMFEIDVLQNALAFRNSFSTWKDTKEMKLLPLELATLLGRTSVEKSNFHLNWFNQIKSSTNRKLSLKKHEPTYFKNNEKEQNHSKKIKREINQPIPTRSFGRNLTAAERCALEGFNGSLACEMEYESPDLAARVFHEILPKLFARTFHMNKTKKENSWRTNNHSKLSSKESRDEKNEKSLNRNEILERSNTRYDIQERIKRSVATAIPVEVCTTNYAKTDHSSHFRHEATNDPVSLYMFRGNNTGACPECHHQQMFLIGSCNQGSSPVVSVPLSDSFVFTCSQARTSALATIMISSEMRNSNQYKNCYQIDNARHVCRDWISYPSQCKLYYSPKPRTT